MYAVLHDAARLELISVLACTLFTGAAFYITAVEHPARLSCGTDIFQARARRGGGH
jgi:hypothetical protein